MSEPAANIIGGDLFDGVPQGVPQFALRAGLEHAQNALNLGHAFFEWSKVWRVGRQILHARPGRFDQVDRTRTVMKPHVIQQNDVAAAQGRREQLLHGQGKDLTGGQ
jgi:hypothetical protein